MICHVNYVWGDRPSFKPAAFAHLSYYVGCCDDSPNRHARAHAQAAQRPIVSSLEPGEDWSWYYIDQVGFRVDGIRGNTHIPPSPMLQ
jgi:hypothetical protein